jgi:putative membrane protein
MASNFQFTQTEKEAIKNAVKEAETTTSGEIVPFFVKESHDYEETNLRAALIFTLLALGISGGLSFSWNLPFAVTPWEVALFAIIMGVIGYLSSRFIAPFRKLLTPKEVMMERIEQRALNAFLTEEVFKTENRTGILILISHFEHMVEVLGDTGINEKVDRKDWEQVVTLITTGIKNNDPASGIVNGIKRCGELLVKAGVAKPSDNPNELSDDIRLG